MPDAESTKRLQKTTMSAGKRGQTRLSPDLACGRV